MMLRLNIFEPDRQRLLGSSLMHRVRCDALMFMVVWAEAGWRGPSAAARIYELTATFP